MCITSLPYCPPRSSHKIPSLLYAVQPSTSSNTTQTTHPIWFICTHATPSKPNRPSASPCTCPNLEIRHPGFNGAKCTRCTEKVLTAAIGVTEEEKVKEAMVEKLREEIERLEKVLGNMKRKLKSLGVVTEKERVQGKGEEGEQRELKDVLEKSLGRNWGAVL